MFAVVKGYRQWVGSVFIAKMVLTSEGLSKTLNDDKYTSIIGICFGETAPLLLQTKTVGKLQTSVKMKGQVTHISGNIPICIKISISS